MFLFLVVGHSEERLCNDIQGECNNKFLYTFFCSADGKMVTCQLTLQQFLTVKGIYFGHQENVLNGNSLVLS